MVAARQMLSDADRARVVAAVAAAERRTRAEIVIVTATSCADYAIFAALWSACAGLLAGAVTVLVAPALGATSVILVEAGTIVVAAALLAVPQLRMWVIPDRVRRAHARQTAGHQFALHVAGRTAERIGVLLFLALAERQVLILPDAAISARIGDERWRDIVDHLTDATHRRGLGDAVVAAVDEVASVLEGAFPVGAGDRNEISDALIELKRDGRT
jgi:putative membrane protein